MMTNQILFPSSSGKTDPLTVYFYSFISDNICLFPKGIATYIDDMKSIISDAKKLSQRCRE